MKQPYWLLCIAKNCDWSRKITSVALDSCYCEMKLKTCIKSRIELQNLQILKEMLEKSSQFLSLEQPCELKSLDFALNVAGGEKIGSENLQLSSTLEALRFKFISDSGNLSPL